MNSRFLIFLVCFLTITAGCTQSSREPCAAFYHKYPENALRARTMQDTLNMIKILDDIISNNNPCLDAYITRADLHRVLSNENNAESDYKKALRIDSINIYILYKLGLLFQDKELYDTSIHFFQRAIDLKTHGKMIVDYPEANNTLSTPENKYDINAEELIYRQGLSFYYARKLHSAVMNFNFCISNNYMLEKAYLFRGAIFTENNNMKAACSDFLQAKKYGSIEVKEYLNKYCK